MDLSLSILGKSAVDHLRARIEAPVLRIGTDTFDRQALSAIACFNFTAAQTLSTILNDGLAVKDTKDVYQNITPQDLALPRLGVIALAVLGAAFELRGLGGETPLESWVRKHAGKADHVTTFTSIKTTVRRSTLRSSQTTRRTTRKRKTR